MDQSQLQRQSNAMKNQQIEEVKQVQTLTQQTTIEQTQPVDQLTGEQQREALPIETLTQEEVMALQCTKPPDYQPLTQAEKDQIGKARKQKKAEAKKLKEYNKENACKIAAHAAVQKRIDARIAAEKVKRAAEEQAKREAEEQAKAEAERLAQIEAEKKAEEEAREAFNAEYNAELKEQTDKVPSVPPDPEVMMKTLLNSEANTETYDTIARMESDHWMKKGALDETNRLEILRAIHMGSLENYVRSTATCDRMNTYMRSNKTINPPGLEKQYADQLSDALQHCKLTTDRVLRRGAHMANLGDMLGLGSMLVKGDFTKDNKRMDKGEAEDMIMAELNRRMASGEEVLMEEKGFCSTSTKMSTGYFREVEFIILAHKGTAGLDISGGGLSPANESELLLAPGTKFRAIKAEERDEDGKKCHRIFLETIPKENQGVKRDSAGDGT